MGFGGAGTGAGGARTAGTDTATDTPTTGQSLQRLAPPALHRPRHRRTHVNGLPRPALPARTPPLHPGPGRHLPHPVLRRPDPPLRPHHPLAPRRTNHPRQRRRALRSLQPHQRNPRLDRQTPARPQTHPRDPDPHRPHLPIHRTPAARDGSDRLAAAGDAATGDRSQPSPPQTPTPREDPQTCRQATILGRVEVSGGGFPGCVVASAWTNPRRPEHHRGLPGDGQRLRRYHAGHPFKSDAPLLHRQPGCSCRCHRTSRC